MKLKLKPPGTERLELNCHETLSTSGFKIKLRRYIMAHPSLAAELAPALALREARASTRPLLISS
jgi:hypothetical protein